MDRRYSGKEASSMKMTAETITHIKKIAERDEQNRQKEQPTNKANGN